jgi:hypothetical protein
MTTTRRHRRCAASTAALALLLPGIAACGDDDSDSDDAATSESTSTTLDEVDPGTVEVTAADYRFDDLPAEVAAGTALALRNGSAEELHELVAMRLADDQDRTAEELVALSESEMGALFAGPPALVLVAPPGEDGFAAVGDGTLGEPGRYLVLCFIPTGADPTAYLDALEANPGQPPSVPGGPPHFTAGMYQEITVR